MDKREILPFSALGLITVLATGLTIWQPVHSDKLFTLYSAECAGLYGYLQNRKTYLQGGTDAGDEDSTGIEQGRDKET
jgi:hypothetical protein